MHIFQSYRKDVFAFKLLFPVKLDRGRIKVYHLDTLRKYVSAVLPFQPILYSAFIKMWVHSFTFYSPALGNIL